MDDYTVTSHSSLTNAGKEVKGFGARAVWLVLGLDGNRYYVFRSQGNSPLTPKFHADAKLSIGDQIKAHAALQSPNHALRPSKVARLEQNAARHTGQTIGGNSSLEGEIQAEMYRRGVRPAAHAEEFLISGYRKCVADYKALRSKSPVKAEIFLSQSPCRVGDPRPSEERVIGGITYPQSCRNKLYSFFAKNKSTSWSVLYDQRFRTAARHRDDEMPGLFPGWTIGRMSKGVRLTLGLQ